MQSQHGSRTGRSRSAGVPYKLRALAAASSTNCARRRRFPVLSSQQQQAGGNPYLVFSQRVLENPTNLASPFRRIRSDPESLPCLARDEEFSCSWAELARAVAQRFQEESRSRRLRTNRRKQCIFSLVGVLVEASLVTGERTVRSAVPLDVPCAAGPPPSSTHGWRMPLSSPKDKLDCLELALYKRFLPLRNDCCGIHPAPWRWRTPLAETILPWPGCDCWSGRARAPSC
mgnify:CR=1 FL=1